MNVCTFLSLYHINIRYNTYVHTTSITGRLDRFSAFYTLTNNTIHINMYTFKAGQQTNYPQPFLAPFLQVTCAFSRITTITFLFLVYSFCGPLLRYMYTVFNENVTYFPHILSSLIFMRGVVQLLYICTLYIYINAEY